MGSGPDRTPTKRLVVRRADQTRLRAEFLPTFPYGSTELQRVVPAESNPSHSTQVSPA